MAKQLEKVFKALANNKRLDILKYLSKEKSASVSDVAEEISLSIKSTSKHLAQLYAADFLARERKSGLTFYALNDTMGKLERGVWALAKNAF